MKKGVLMLTLFLLIVTGCSSAPKATEKIIFSKTVENQEVSELYQAIYTYNDEEVISSEIKVEFKNMNLDINNPVFLDYRILASSISEINGAMASVEDTESGYIYRESWDYTKVNIDNSISMDERQTELIEDDKFSLNKIKEYYRIRGYSSQVETIK